MLLCLFCFINHLAHSVTRLNLFRGRLEWELIFPVVLGKVLFVLVLLNLSF